MFSPLLTTATSRSHQGPHGAFSSGYGGCCPPVFNPGTLFALISGIALATYFLRLVIVVTEFTKRSFPDPWLLNTHRGLYMAEEKFGDLANVTKAIHENDVESNDGEGWVSWVDGIVTELVDFYRQETEGKEEKEKEEEEDEVKKEKFRSEKERNVTNTTESEWGSCRSEAWQ